jgi:hypothetical protein
MGASVAKMTEGGKWQLDEKFGGEAGTSNIQHPTSHIQ